MKPPILTRDLTDKGLTSGAIERSRRRGDLTRVRRGAYLLSNAEVLEAAAQHRQLIDATMPQLRADAVLSHTSAAVLHGLPVWGDDLGKVHLTRPRTGGGGKRRLWLAIHTQPLAPAEVGTIDGLPVTSLERTVFDLARTLPFERAVAAGDRALAMGMALDILAEMVERGRQWAGVRRAHQVAEFIDALSGSAGESVSRVRIRDFHLPKPTLQLPAVLRDGTTARGDFGWEEFKTIGEFDGQVKYERLLRPGEKSSDVVVREKRREDMLRALGWQIVRWIWDDLENFGPIAQALLAAFQRGRVPVGA